MAGNQTQWILRRLRLAFEGVRMIELNPIGIIHTPFTKPEGMPIQPAGATAIHGTIEVFEEFHAGLNYSAELN